MRLDRSAQFKYIITYQSYKCHRTDQSHCKIHKKIFTEAAHQNKVFTQGGREGGRGEDEICSGKILTFGLWVKYCCTTMDERWGRGSSVLVISNSTVTFAVQVQLGHVKIYVHVQSIQAYGVGVLRVGFLMH